MEALTLNAKFRLWDKNQTLTFGGAPGKNTFGKFWKSQIGVQVGKCADIVQSYLLPEILGHVCKGYCQRSVWLIEVGMPVCQAVSNLWLVFPGNQSSFIAHGNTKLQPELPFVLINLD